MPFASEKQRKYLWANHPDIARKWEHEAKKKHTSPIKKSHKSAKD